MSAIEQRLRETVGLDPASLGSTSLARIILQRMKRVGALNLDDYNHLLELSPAAWTDLLEAVLVAETWFFRDREAIDALARVVRDSWLPAHSSGTLRLLSLPCSTGEEPYSIVMALLDAGVPPERFHVDAVDISARALTSARRAVYGRNSFRKGELDFRGRHFQSTPEGYVLAPGVRNCVHFSQANVLESGLAAAPGNYDYIFFRNLLIYFDPAARKKALDKIARLMGPAGILFVGPAEQSLLLDHGFASASLPFAFAGRDAYRRPERTVRRVRAEPPVPEPPELFPLPTNLAKTPARFAEFNSRRSRSGGARRSLPDDLEHARRLTEAGRLTEAAAICEAHLSQSRTSAQAYYLLGVVRDARGESNAIEYYRKALYLEPNHYESLMRMAVFASQHGDAAGARNFRRRAERLKANA